MFRSSRTSCGGFTYLAALMMIMIMGIMLGMVGQSWSALMKREKEEELLFRGNQIAFAIARWNDKTKTGHPPTPIRELKDLLKDPRSLEIKRYLRSIYNDPITGKDWEEIKDPVKGVVGVASKSDARPLRQKNFADYFGIPKNSKDPVTQKLRAMYDSFEGKEKYSEWKFVYGQASVPPTTPGTLNTTPTPLTPFPGTGSSTGSGTGQTSSGQSSSRPGTSQTSPTRQPEPDSTIWNRRNESGW